MALKTFLGGQQCFALLLTGFGESCVKCCGGAVTVGVANVTVTNLIGRLQCEQWIVRPITFRDSPSLSKRFLLQTI